MTSARKYQPWTTREESLVRELYQRIGGAALAAKLGRPLSAVRVRAGAIGATFDRRAELGPEFESFLREKNAAGWSDDEIAAAWGANHCTVRKHRNLLGLPHNRFGPRHCEKIRKRVRLQCQDAGVKNLVGLRWASRRLALSRQGWPSGTTVGEAGLLEILERGPAKRRELVGHLRFITPLVRKGWIVRVRHGVYAIAVNRQMRTEAA
jgi:hypothetical protein